MPYATIIAIAIVTIALLLLFILAKKPCRHEWRRIYSETMWESNVRIVVYQCTRCGKIKREYITT